jgi:hypothetical protein
MKLKTLSMLAGTVAFAGMASATVINGSSLQDGLNSITQGNQFYDVSDEANQYNPDEVWEITSSNGSITRLVFEFAGFANQASFGIYDLADTNNRLEIFSGNNCGTAESSCTDPLNFDVVSDGVGGYFTSVSFNSDTNLPFEIDPLTGLPTTFYPYSSATFSSSNFGYYLDSGNGVLFSQAHLNGDLNNDGADDDHMVAFQGDGSTMIDINGGTDYKEFGQNEFILAWEDLTFQGTNSDYDYSDFVVLVESVSSVFEPGSMALFGLGLAGLAASRRRQKA